MLSAFTLPSSPKCNGAVIIAFVLLHNGQTQNVSDTDNFPKTAGKKITAYQRFFWWPEAESNRRHTDFQSVALPTELSGLCLSR